MPDGRHRSAQSRGPFRIAPSIIIGAIVVVVLAVATTGYALVVRHGGCTGSTALTVLTDPSDQPTLETLANKWDGGTPSVGGRCVNLTIAGKADQDTAAALSTTWDPSRDGPRPDVWAPDASTWVRLAQLRTDGAAVIPSAQPSVMVSPVVIAMPRTMASALGWPVRQLTWADLVTDMGNSQLWAQHGHPDWGAPKLGMTNPAADTAGLSALLSVSDNDGDGVLRPAELAQSLAFGREVTRTATATDTFFQAMQQADQAGKPLSYLSAFPATEQAIAQYNQQGGLKEKLVAVYPPEASPAANHPYLTLKAPWVTSQKQRAATAFLDYLRSDAAQKSLQGQGFRTPNGTASSALSTANGFERILPTVDRPVETSSVVGRAIATWTQLRTTSNNLVVIDTSGSMADPAPGTTTSKLSLVQRATTDILPLFSSSSGLSLWSFSTGSPPYRVLVPEGPLTAARRASTTASLARLKASGATSLYDTVLAAYKQGVKDYQPGRKNVVLFLTDGKNEVAGGLTQAQLLKDLVAAKDPKKPVTFLTIGYGSAADVPALQAISRATGGRTYVSTDPADIGQVYLSALVGS